MTTKELVALVAYRGGHHVRLLDRMGNNIAHTSPGNEVWDCEAITAARDLYRAVDRQAPAGVCLLADVALASIEAQVEALLSAGLASGDLTAEMVAGEGEWERVA